MADVHPLLEDGAYVYESEDPEEEARLDAEAEADIAAGRTISWEAVKRWMLSWGTPNELPAPEIGD